MTNIIMPIWKDYHILTSFKPDKKVVVTTIMTYLTEDEEQKLDNNETINITRGDDEFSIKPNDVYCYGNVDFSTNSQDYKIIENFKFLDYLTSKGLPIPSRYDYENHVCESDINRCLWSETWNPAEIAQFAHGSLGKPNKVLLFSYIKTK